MTRIFHRLLVFFIVVSSSMMITAQSNTSEEAFSSMKLTLMEAIDIALQDNPTIIIAGKEVEIKKQAKKEALWNMLPEATLNGSYSHTIKKQTMAMDMGGEVQTFKVGMKHNYNGALNIGVPIFAPALYKTMNMSKDDVNLAVEKARASKLDLMNEVVKAYFQILLAQDSHKVLYKSLQQAEENLKIVSSKFEFGKVSEYDKIRAEVQMRSIKPSVVSAQNAVRLAKVQLKVLLGISSPIDLVIEDNLNDYEAVLKSDNLIGTDPSTIDLSNNTDLNQLSLSESILRQNVKLQRTNYLPTISLDYNYTYMAMDNKSNIFHYKWYPTSSIGVRMSIPLFRGSNITRMKQSKIELAKMFYTKSNTERQIRMMASSYLDNMLSSSEQLESNKLGVEQALKGQEIARKMYEVGKGTILELNDSEVALVQAELALNQAIFDYLVAQSDYAKVLGNENFYKTINN